jgi:galactose mutarotase-like enzyme
MTHSISNQILALSVQHKGVEISSLKSLKTNTEYIWDANPSIWGSHAPVLFPIIGALKDGLCQIDGKQYAIPKHGIIRHNDKLELITQEENSLEFQLRSSAETEKIYPYKFNFCIKYQLVDNRLIVAHLVENTDDKAIYFALGAHPAFKCPFNSGESFGDYFLEFTTKETASRWMLDKSGLLSGEKTSYLNGSQQLALREDMFNEDALVFTDLQSKEVSLKSEKTRQSIKVSFEDFPYLGLWAKPKANFICIEPWQGLTDSSNSDGDFIKKQGLIKLDQGDTYRASYTITIDEF